MQVVLAHLRRCHHHYPNFLAMSQATQGPYKKLRKTFKSQAEIIYILRRYFEKEKTKVRVRNLNQIVVRTCAATGFSKKVVPRIRNEEDFAIWKYEDGEKVSCSKPSKIRIIKNL